MIREQEQLKKEDFDKLWSINPSYENETQSYENAYYALVQLIKYPDTTPDGKITDFNLIYKRYKEYFHVKSMINEGVDPKFMKKENKILPIFQYIWDKMYKSEVQVPETGKHFYFWGLNNSDEIKSHYKIFEELCKKK